MTLLLGGYFELGKIKSAEKFMYGIIMFIIILIFIVIFVGERLFAIFDIVEEASGFIRLVLPFIRIRDLIGDGYFFGVPSGLFNEIFPPFYQGVEVGLGIDNSVFNLIMNYGFCGIIILGYVFKLMGAQASLFLFCVGQFNGALLGYDRAALVGFVLCQFYSNRSLLKINK